MKKLLVTICALSAAALLNAETVVYVSSNGVNDGSFYTGPENATINGVAYKVVCYDASHDVWNGQSWKAALYNINDLTKNSYFTNQADYLTKYKEATWLSAQFNDHPTSDWNGIQHAIWNLNVPGFEGTPSDGNSWTTLAQTQASLGFQGFNFNNYRYINSVPGSTPVQGFIVATATPEPASLALVGAGLFGIAFLRRKMLSKRRSEVC